MNYKDIINDIKNRNIKNTYLFYGKEYYLIENAIKEIKLTLNDGMIDFNLDIIDGREIALDQLISSIETLPFMDDRKIVILKDFELLKGKKKNFSDEDEKYFTEYIDNIPQTTTLVFIVYGDIDKRKSLVKKISKNGIVFNCDKLSDMDLFKWVKKKFDNKNVLIDNAQIMYFINQEGYLDKSSEKTLSDLENEINKISSFVGKALKQTKNFSDEVIIDILNSILESDFKIKNGLVRDTLSIEMLISKYCKKGN